MFKSKDLVFERYSGTKRSIQAYESKIKATTTSMRMTTSFLAVEKQSKKHFCFLF
jgi:hypothetical protein